MPISSVPRKQTTMLRFHWNKATFIVLVTWSLAPFATATAEPIKISAAGSLVAPLKELIAASGIAAEPTFGPAGSLRERLEKGEAADLFLSADLAQPRKLVAAKRATLTIPFARNTLCTLSHGSLGLNDQNLLDKMTDPAVRLATSTPHADPGGDYTWAIFDKADALRAGATETLKSKALKLIGSPGAMVPIAGKTPAASIFLGDKADILIYYCSGQKDTLRDVPDLVSRPLPAALDVTAVYGLTFLTQSSDAERFALFLLSDEGQAILARHELKPVLGAD
jgi:molybdate transport system substrate-binding protein